MKSFNLEVYVDRVLFSAHANGTGFFGIYSVSPVKEDAKLHHVKISKYGNFTVKGNSFELKEGEQYTIKVGEAIPDKQKRFADSYELLSVEPPRLVTKKEQDAFLQQIVTEREFQLLNEAFPNEKLIDLIEAGKLKAGMVKGIGEATIEKIKNKISENSGLASLMVLLEDYGLTVNRLESILKHFVDPLVAYEKIKGNIYSLTEIRGWGFKTVDEIVLKQGVPHTKEQRAQGAVDYILQDALAKGNTWVSLEELLGTSSSLLQDEETFELVEKVTLKDNKYKISFGNLVSFSYIFALEESILFHLQRIEKDAKTVEIKDLEERVATIEKGQGFAFTEEQRQAIINAHTKGVSLITGGAGTGKSATIKGVAYTTPAMKYATMALSGKAVDVIMEKGVASATMHRSLGLGSPSGGVTAGKMPNIHDIGADSKKFIDPLEQDIIIVDEFSMVDVVMYEKLFSMIPSGTRLVLVGDHGQLPPVGFGDVARALIKTERFPITQLTKVHRQALESGIIELAYKIRNGEQLSVGEGNVEKLLFGKKKDASVFLFNSRDFIMQALRQVLENFQNTIAFGNNDIMDLHIVAPMRKYGTTSVTEANKLAQEIFNPSAPHKTEIKHKGSVLRVGDKVMASGNTYDIPILDRENYMIKNDDTTIYNGTVGIIKRIETGKERSVVIDFPREEGLVLFEADKLKNIDLAYASTVHKMQGSSAKYVVGLLDYGAYIMLSRQLAYVMTTRAEEGFVMLTEKGAIEQAIRTNASEQRNAFLGKLIEKQDREI